MKTVDRRLFLKTTALAVGAGVASRYAPSTWAQPLGANGDIRFAVIGINDKGHGHIEQLLELPGARVVAVCDVDPTVLYREVASLQEKQVKVFATTDARKVFERPDVDAVVIATSNHWHALLTVWACQAGKDVYVEKPVSHTVWEGRKMVEAAEKYGRVVQAGTQFRSDSGLPEAIAYVKEGHIGKIQAIHAVCYKYRENIGRALPWYPEWLDYDMFCGPTPLEPLQRPKLLYDWHWVWRTGNGEIGNNGIHVLDIARRFAGHDAYPQRVMSVGGKYGREDANETPNTHMAVYDYGTGVPVLFEARGLPMRPDTTDMDHYRGVRVNGFAVLCEGGYFSGYAGGGIYDPDGKQITRFPGDAGAGHMQNFLEAVRNRRPQEANAPIKTGHESTALCHFGNISYRLGRTASPAEIQQSLEGFDEALNTLEGMKQHLSIHGFDVEQQPFTLGPWLNIDADNESIAAVEGGDDGALAYARHLLKETQRAPYAMPDRV